MIPLHLFRNVTFSGANLLTLLVYSAMGALMFFLPFNLVQVHGYSPVAAGGSMMPLVILLAVLSRPAGLLADRYGVRRPLIIGPLIVGFGLLLLALPGTQGSYWTTFFPGMTVLGLGMAITVAPLTTAVMASAGQERAGVASGINNAVSRAGGLLSIALAGLLAYERFGASLARRLDVLAVPASVREHLIAERNKLAAATIPASVPLPVQRTLEQVVHYAFVDAFRSIMLLAAALCVGAAVAAWRFITPVKPVDSTPTTTRDYDHSAA
jgi:MFS family permease